MSKIIFITSGDIDGIGLEVAVKALCSIKKPSGVKFVLFAHPDHLNKYTKRLRKKFSCLEYDDFHKIELEKKANLFMVKSALPPVEWVIQSTNFCLKNPKEAALVTGPLSKTGIQDSGYEYIGHTDLLKNLSNSIHLFQVYLGSKMNVILVTDHVPLKKVPSLLENETLIESCVNQALLICESMKLKGNLGYLALDPHAGENGVIGRQDQDIKRVLGRLKSKKRKIVGPLPADTAFVKGVKDSIGMYIANYHDQGLIPFKTLHGFDEGVHLTAGLPFVRTSVDHGTAKELFNKNKANPGSMKEALKTAIKMLRSGVI